jgi:hypothetical protein
MKKVKLIIHLQHVFLRQKMSVTILLTLKNNLVRRA